MTLSVSLRATQAMMLNERMHEWHLSISASACPQTHKHRGICHHRDKVECGMTEISNLHNKQWNSNYQPVQTIFPAVTFGLWDCSIIHWHSRLAGEKKNRRIKLKEWRRRQLRGLIDLCWFKTSVGTNLNKVIIYSCSDLFRIRRGSKTTVTLYSVSCEMSEVGWHLRV